MVPVAFIFVALQIGLSLTKAIDNTENLAALKTIANDGLQFSHDFYKDTAKAQPGNFICSPVSASTILSMLTYGARGNTETALKNGLHFNNDDNIQKKGIKTLVEELNDSPGVELRLANKIFLAKDVDVKPAYQQLTEDVFKSSTQKVDFSKTAEASKTINDWCEQQTNSKIKNVVSPDTLDPTTQAVLVNAAYFKGKWQTEFNKKLTYDAVFHLEDGTTKNIPTMHIQHNCNYGVMSDVKAKFAELPYQGGEVSMFIVVPDEIAGLKNLQENFDKFNFNRLLNEGSETELYFSMPKFEIETKIDLQKPLTNLGMGNIFQNTADFSELSEVPMKVGEAIQKAYVKVDEEGTEAAAVTELTMIKTTALEPPSYVILRANRPFFYAIIKKVGGPQGSGIVLFQGHYKGDN